jgi:hypothetical protein
MEFVYVIMGILDMPVKLNVGIYVKLVMGLFVFLAWMKILRLMEWFVSVSKGLLKWRMFVLSA